MIKGQSTGQCCIRLKKNARVSPSRKVLLMWMLHDLGGRVQGLGLKLRLRLGLRLMLRLGRRERYGVPACSRGPAPWYLPIPPNWNLQQAPAENWGSPFLELSGSCSMAPARPAKLEPTSKAGVLGRVQGSAAYVPQRICERFALSKGASCCGFWMLTKDSKTKRHGGG